MKNYLAPLVFASAVSTACSGAQLDQNTEPVTVQITAQSPNTPKSSPEEKQKKPGKPEPVVQITREMRWHLHNMACGQKNWDSCGKEVNDLFWELTKKIPKDVDRKCREDGDYTEGCVEKAYEQHVGNDTLLQEYSAKQKACKESYDQCTMAAEQNCDQKCWKDIKEEIEKQKNLIDDGVKDKTAP